MIADIIRSTKAPYDKFPHPISLSELVDICVEVWEGDSDDD